MKNTLLALSIVTLFVIAGQTAHAQVVPFKASGDDATYNPDPKSLETLGLGKATHMGKIVGSGVAEPGEELGPGLFAWSALDYQLTAKNGDTIFLTGGGVVQFVPIEGDLFFAVWTGEFTVTGGNGRFCNVGPAAEPLQVTAINNPFTFPAAEGDIWTYDWEISGQIDLGKKGKKK